jgi:ABC-type molybdate transport system ATPase subunit
MSSSGGGKTTLLNVLSGRASSSEASIVLGDVLLNERVVTPAEMRAISSYVQQV